MAVWQRKKASKQIVHTGSAAASLAAPPSALLLTFIDKLRFERAAFVDKDLLSVDGLLQCSLQLVKLATELLDALVQRHRLEVQRLGLVQ